MSEPTIRDKLSYDAFRENLNTKFDVMPTTGSKVELAFTAISEHILSSLQERFSLTFRGPSETFLPQSTYRFNHPKMGEFDMFIVPIGRDEDGFIYEAVFNNLIKK
jgi:hypothetical protein